MDVRACMDGFKSRDAAGLQLQVIDIVHAYDRVHELSLTEQMKTDMKDESRRDMETNALQIEEAAGGRKPQGKTESVKRGVRQRRRSESCKYGDGGKELNTKVKEKG
jgi:hypothetical protein